MGLINVTAVQDGDANDENLYNSRFSIIVDEINGNLDADNLATSAVTTPKIADANVTTVKIADANVTAAKLVTGGTGHGYVEIARTTLGTAGDTITVSSIPEFKYLKFVLSGVATGGTLDTSFRINNDSGTNYAHRYSANHAAETAAVSQTSNPVDSGATDSGSVLWAEVELVDIAAESKLLTWFSISEDATGGATNPVVIKGYGKWANTSVVVNRFDWLNLAGTGDFAIGSEVIVYGHN